MVEESTMVQVNCFSMIPRNKILFYDENSRTVVFVVVAAAASDHD